MSNFYSSDYLVSVIPADAGIPKASGGPGLRRDDTSLRHQQCI
jgi:hypothetical protein